MSVCSRDSRRADDATLKVLLSVYLWRAFCRTGAVTERDVCGAAAQLTMADRGGALK